MFCAYCGSARPDDAVFWPSCGRAIQSTTLSPASQASYSGSGFAVLIPPSSLFFNVGTAKLVLMSVSTFNTYAIYWLYKNWVAEREHSREPIAPWARALFAGLFIYSLASRVTDRLLVLKLTPTLRPVLTTVAFIGLSVCGQLDDPFWLFASLAGLSLIPLQNEMGRLNVAVGASPTGPEARFSAVNIVWLTIAALLSLLMIVGMFLPEVE